MFFALLFENILVDFRNKVNTQFFRRHAQKCFLYTRAANTPDLKSSGVFAKNGDGI